MCVALSRAVSRVQRLRGLAAGYEECEWERGEEDCRCEQERGSGQMQAVAGANGGGEDEGEHSGAYQGGQAPNTLHGSLQLTLLIGLNMAGHQALSRRAAESPQSHDRDSGEK